MHNKRCCASVCGFKTLRDSFFASELFSLASRMMWLLRTCIKSLKKSTLTRCAYLDIPLRAAGKRGVGWGFLSIWKYKTKRSFRVSVCFATLVSTSEAKRSSVTYRLCPLFFVYFRSCLAHLTFNPLLFLESFPRLLAQIGMVRRFSFGRRSPPAGLVLCVDPGV